MSRAEDVAALFAAVTADAPGCAAAIVERGEIVWQGCFGLADLATHRPITAETPFRICSITKPMTALVFAALAEEGTLSFDDPAGRHLLELSVPEMPSIADLLGMRAGLWESYPLTWLALGPEVPPGLGLSHALALILAQRGQNFAPGTRTLYANSGYTLLQAIAERATGTPFADLLRRHVWAPAGMTSTALIEGDTGGHPNMARAYARGTGDAFVPAETVSAFGAAGGAVSTIADMARWVNWLRTDPHHWTTRLAGDARHLDGSASGYALGFQTQRLSGERLAGHSGGIAGWLCDVAWLPDRDVAAIVLGNRNDQPWIERTREMLVRWTGIAPDPAMTPALLAPSGEPRWQAVYAGETQGVSHHVAACEAGLVCDARLFAPGSDGGFHRNLGVEPIGLFVADDATPPSRILRREGNHEIALILTGEDAPPPLASLTGTYRHPDMPEPLVVMLDESGALRVAVGVAWPASPPLFLRHLHARLFRAYDAKGVAQELHVRFDDPAAALIASFVRITAMRFVRSPADEARDIWRARMAVMPHLLEPA